MNYRVFATDFDGTIATDGVVDEETTSALQRLRHEGMISCLVTGRDLRDFETAPGALQLFDYVIAENGALLYVPATEEIQVLAPEPEAAFLEELNRRGVPVRAGRVIVATVEPYESVVLEVIKERALELQVIFNKGAVMVLPSGVNKATGLEVVLDRTGMVFSEVVGVGDAENDHVFLDHCGLSVAVANAVPALKERAMMVTHSNAGAGVTELVAGLLEGKLDVVLRKER